MSHAIQCHCALCRNKALQDQAKLRWVSCEACGGSGEIIRGQTPDEHSDLCGACEGTGRDCVEVSPVECDDCPTAEEEVGQTRLSTYE